MFKKHFLKNLSPTGSTEVEWLSIKKCSSHRRQHAGKMAFHIRSLQANFFIYRQAERKFPARLLARLYKYSQVTFSRKLRQQRGLEPTGNKSAVQSLLSLFKAKPPAGSSKRRNFQPLQRKNHGRNNNQILQFLRSHR